MARTYIIGSNAWMPLAAKLDATLAHLPAEGLNSEKKVHDFMVSTFTEEPSLLVMEMGQNPGPCLSIAMHVRLSQAHLPCGYLCPIVFASDRPLSSFLSYGQSQVLLTENVYLCTPSEIISRRDDFRPMPQDRFRGGFLDRVSVRRPEGSNHSLANQWGASRLYRIVSGKDISAEEYRDFMDVQKELYFKYIINKVSRPFTGPAYPQNEKMQESLNKKVLLIDDEADKGWARTMKLIFAEFDPDRDVICEKVSCYDDLSDSARAKIEGGGYDLFLLDLRLGGESEDSQTEPEKMSGYNVLRRIKTLNKGNQVMMLTASNKAWNMRALLDPIEGASGYFVKESPEYEFSDEFSVANLESFRKDAGLCFDRGYLRGFWSFMEDLKKRIDGERNRARAEFLEDVYAQMDIAFGLCAQADSETLYQYAFIAIFQVLEAIVSHYGFFERKGGNKQRLLFMKGQKGDVKCVKVENYIDCRFHLNAEGKQFMTGENHKSFSQWDKISVLLLQSWGRKDDGLIYLLGQLILVRNALVHKTSLKKEVESMRKILFDACICYPDFLDDRLFFSRDLVREGLYDASLAHCLYDRDGHHFRLHPSVTNCKAAPKLMLECLMTIIPLI